MDSTDIMIAGLLLLAAVSVGAIVYLLVNPYFSGERRTDKRIQGATESKAPASACKAQADLTQNRKRAGRRNAEGARGAAEGAREGYAAPAPGARRSRDRAAHLLDRQHRLRAAWLASASGCRRRTCRSLCPCSAPLSARSGLPRWILGRLTKRRQNKFTDEFANSIDIIVRGVKSGLPLDECLGIIARESPQPIAGEFTELVEQQRVGVPLAEGFERMMRRMPLPEVRFFAIVIAIQQQAGGNLSEALGNLSGVLRDRKRLQAKVRALSAEAKASAAVLGSLPFIVMILVYITTPSYITLLWTTQHRPVPAGRAPASG